MFNNIIDRETGIEMDILIKLKNKQKIVINAEGPHHYLFFSKRMNGKTLYRNNILKASGYTVINIPGSLDMTLIHEKYLKKLETKILGKIR